MINRPPRDFTLTEDTMNLFLFFQCVNEMTFDFSPDTYKSKTLNTRLLCKEAVQTYEALYNTSALEKYYNVYLNSIIDELRFSLANDKAAKALLENRYERLLSELEKLPKNRNLFESTMRNLLNYFANRKYYNELVKSICENVCNGGSREELIKYINDWIAEILSLGFSKQHIYNFTTEFFTTKEIIQAAQIYEYFDKLKFKTTKWDCITIVDKKISVYLNSLGSILGENEVKLTRMSEDELKQLVQEDEFKSLNWLLDYYSALHAVEKVELIRYSISALDPYRAAEKMQFFMNLFVNIITTVDNDAKKVYTYNACLNYSKSRIKVKPAMQRRNRKYEQSYLPAVLKMLKSLRVSQNTFTELMKVMAYHGDAITQGLENKYVVTTLWTSLEMLFSNNTLGGTKGDKVKSSLIEILQRTYIVKRLKYLHDDFLYNIKAYNKKELIEQYHLDDFESFVKLLFETNESEAKKSVQQTIEKNPLLRIRVYNLICKEMGSGQSIQKMLSDHKRKISWHIERIYRSRNFLVHAGEEFWYEDLIVECLHNYVDFVVNYILAKTQAGEYITEITDVISEAQIDNEIHNKILANNTKAEISIENFKELLFGPSENILRYYKNHIV